MHRMRCHFAKVGLIFCLAVFVHRPAECRADLIQKNAEQSFPDLAGDVAGTQHYQYDPSSGTGVFQVKSAPSLLATGPKESSEFYVDDPPGQSRRQSIQIKLDANGNLVRGDPGNSYSLTGSVRVNGKTYSGLLLQGTPDQFGWRPPTDKSGSTSVYDLHMNLTGGLLKQAYGPDAYVRIVSETDGAFDGTFKKSFLGKNTETNVRAYNAPSPLPVPEPSTFAILLTCGGAGLLYRRRRRSAASDLSSEE